MTIEPGLCLTWSEPKFLVFSRTGSHNSKYVIWILFNYLDFQNTLNRLITLFFTHSLRRTPDLFPGTVEGLRLGRTSTSIEYIAAYYTRVVEDSSRRVINTTNCKNRKATVSSCSKLKKSMINDSLKFQT